MFEIDYQLTRADLLSYQKAATARLKAAASKTTPVWTKLALWIGLVVLFAVGFNVAENTTSMDTFSMLVGAWLGLLLVTVLSLRSGARLRSAMYTEGGPSLASHHAVFDETAMRVRTAKMSAVYHWDLFTDITSDTEQMTLWLEPCLGFVIPLRAFATNAETTAFAAFARERIAAAAPTSPHTS